MAVSVPVFEQQDSISRLNSLQVQHQILKVHICLSSSTISTASQLKAPPIFCQNQHEDLKKQYYDLQDQHQAQGDDHNQQLDEHRERYDKLQQIKELEVSQLKGGHPDGLEEPLLAPPLSPSSDITRNCMLKSVGGSQPTEDKT